MKFDYIFCGFGLSTSLILEELEVQNLLYDKLILIIDSESSFSEKNFCFWERGSGKWDALISGEWHNAIAKDEKGRIYHTQTKHD